MKSSCKNIYFIFLALLSFSVICAQNNRNSVIKGTVYDKETGEALSGASVYFNGTTLGTIVLKNGSYMLEVNKAGNYELIISMIGFEVEKRKIFVKQGSVNNYNFKLVPKPVNIKTVEVEGDDQKEWKRSLDIFRRKFLGSLDPAYHCEIENKEFLNFKWTHDTLNAYSDKPIIVKNNYIGYLISFQIKKFSYSPMTSEQEFLYTSFFRELKPEDQSQMENWKKNREEIFYGSPVHFLWALRNGRLFTEKYKLYFTSDPKQATYDILKEVVNTETLLNAEQLTEDPTYSFGEYMKVVYKNRDESFIQRRGAFFSIDKNGIADNHLPFLCMGYWANLGAACLLPLDYLPESLKKD